MNPITALATIISASKQHPWLLFMVAAYYLLSWADMNWPGYHLTYLSKGAIGLAALYAAGATVQSKPDSAPVTKPNVTTDAPSTQEHAGQN